jgi:formylglycine-generating enzyme required for sulfatase activity
MTDPDANAPDGTDPGWDALGRLLAVVQGQLGFRPTSRELAEVLWLADRIDSVPSAWSARVPAEPEQNAADGKEQQRTDADSGKQNEKQGQGDDSKPKPDATDAPPRTRAYPTTAAAADDAGAHPATTVDVPDRAFLTQSLALGRTWRRLRRRLPARREPILDIQATAARIAAYELAGTPVWEPIWRPGREPWLDLTLVIDNGPAMPIWEPLVNEIETLLRRTGAFAQLRLQTLETGQATAELREGCPKTNQRGKGRKISEKARGKPLPGRDPARTLTLVLTDCISAGWYQPSTLELLARLGRGGLLAVLQLMPPTRWIDTALGLGEQLWLRPVPRRPSALPSLAPSRPRRDATDPPDTAGNTNQVLDLPVIDRSPLGVADLTDALLGGIYRLRLLGYRLNWTEPASVTESPYVRARTQAERLDDFLSVASPAARRLAGYLSRVPYPLTVRMMHLVQRSMAPRDDLSALAEVFSGGLLEEIGDGLPTRYRLIGLDEGEPGGGSLVSGLADLISHDEAWQVLERVSADLERRGHPGRNWNLVIEDAAAGKRLELPEALITADADAQPFALIALDIARRRGGAYLQGAQRIEQWINRPVTEVPKEPTAPTEPMPFQDRYADETHGPKMVWLPGGPFTMGSPEGVGGDREHPAHRVQLSHYALGRFPVTVGEFRRFIEATGYVTEAEQGGGAWVWNRGHPGNKVDASWHNPYMDQDDNHPVICISWNDAKAYCDWLSEETGQPYGLLSEVQWEYACRAGEQGRWCFGDDEDGLDDYAWYGRRSGDGTHPIGTKRPNAWQLHDMHGNVWEWCTDWFDANTYKERAARIGEAAESRDDSRSEAAAAYIVDPIGPETGSLRVVRGGSWGNDADYCRSACRDGNEPSLRNGILGFRLSRTGPLHSYPFTLDRDDKKQEKVPAYLTGLQDTLGDGGQAPAMVWLRGGQFRMGQDDSRWDWEKPAHPVEVSAFSIGQYPLTFDEYDRFCEATKRKKPGDRGWGRGRRPVINISWGDAQAYCNWLNGQQKTGTYRLLTEAEWEFACRAGSDTRWSCGNDEKQLGEYAWYGENAQGKTHPVGEKKPNAWQLHDMHGNIWEWCADWFDANSYKERAVPTSRDVESSSYSRSDAAAAYIYDPTGPETGSSRVVRGGSWDDVAGDCRSACRGRIEPSDRDNYLGFRLSRTGPWPSYPFTLVRDDEGASEQPDAAQEPPTPQAETFAPQQGFRDRFVIVRKDGRAERADVGREGPEMVYLPGGTFLMGDEQGNDDEKPVHRVALDAFAMGRTPVTWGEYRRFCEDTGSHWPKWLEEGRPYHLEKGIQSYYIHCGVARDALDLPVVGVAWDDAVAYCAWLAERTDRPYRLPTEAEWEYACRAGTKTRWSFGDDEKALDDYGWYRKNAQGKLHPVGQQRPNPWGLLDMHGNVWEWCADWYAEDAYKKRAQAMRSAGVGEGESAVADRYSAGASAYIAKAHDISTEDPSVGSGRVVRGGSWRDDADYCRSACRVRYEPSVRGDGLGFRLSRTV